MTSTFKSSKRYSMKSLLVLSCMTIGICIQIVALVFSYRMLFNVSQQDLEDNTIRTFQQVEANVNSLLSNINQIYKLLTWNSIVSEYLNYEWTSQIGHIETTRTLFNYLDELIKSYDSVHSIYIYRQDNFMIGVSKDRTWQGYSNEQPLPFQRTPEYRQAMEGKKGILWMGSFHKWEFDFITYNINLQRWRKKVVDSNYQYSPDDEVVISAVMPVLTFWKSECPAVIVINFYENQIRSIYERLASKGGQIYILDAHGKQLSGIDERKCGHINPNYYQIDPSLNYGSFTKHGTDSRMQVVFYRMKSTNWVLVNEIPFKTFTRNVSKLQQIMLITFIISSLLIITLYSIWIRHMMSPLKKVIIAMESVGEGNFGVRLPAMPYSELDLLSRQFNKMLEKLTELMRKNEETQNEKRILEIQTLQAQINPHFIYNTITNIRWMASMVKATGVSNALAAFGNILRPVFSKTNISWTIEEEIEFIKNYADIMNYRFGGGIAYTYYIEPGTAKCEILRFTLQPLIENSFTHGLKTLESGEITVEVKQEKEQLIIRVQDNGVGIPQEELNQLNKGLYMLDQSLMNGKIGLYNINKRIKLHYGACYGIKLLSQWGKGTVAILELPLNM